MELYIKDLEFSGYNTDQINQIILAADKGLDLTAIFAPNADIKDMRSFRQKYKNCSKEKLELISYAYRIGTSLNIAELIEKYNYPTIKLYLELEKEGLLREHSSHLVGKNYNKTQSKKLLEFLKDDISHLCSDKMYSTKRSSKDYELYKEYKKRGILIDKFLDEGYNFDQLEVINKYMSKWIDLTSIMKPHHPAAFFEFIGEKILDIRDDRSNLECTEKQLINIINQGYNYKQTRELFYAIEACLDYKKMLCPGFNHHQMSVIGWGLYTDINVDIYAHPKYTADQMDAIKIATTRMAEKKIPDNPYNYFDYTMIINSNNYTGQQMKEIIRVFDIISKRIEDKNNIKKLFYSNTLEELKKIAEDYLEKEKYSKLKNSEPLR